MQLESRGSDHSSAGDGVDVPHALGQRVLAPRRPRILGARFRRQAERAEQIQDRAEHIQERSAQLVGGARKAIVVVLAIVAFLIAYLS